MRSNQLRLLPDKAQESELRLLGDRVSALWNAANHCSRQACLAGERVPTYISLCAEFASHPAYKALPSDIAQETLKKLSEAWRSYFALRALWKAGGLPHTPGLPTYRKNRNGTRPTGLVPIKSARSYAVSSDSFSVTLPPDRRDIHGGRLVSSHRGALRYRGESRRGEIMYDQGRSRWYFCHSVEMPTTALKPWSRMAAIDLGIRVLASLSIEGIAQAQHFSGREVLKDWDYWGRRISDHMRQLSHRPTSERSSRRLRQLHCKRKDRLVHAWEALAARIVAVLRVEHVGTVYLGWPKDIRRDTSYTKSWNGRIHGFWSFDLALTTLEKHLSRAGIAAIRVGERGTSSECPFCHSGNVTRHPRHVLTCRDCTRVIHSDQAGSRNILSFNQPSVTWDGLEASPRPDTHQWNRHRWVDAAHRSASAELLVMAQCCISHH
jgi:putative transposase